MSSWATAAGLLSLTSLAVHRPARLALVVTALWVPVLLVFAAYSPATGPVSVLLLVTPLALVATAWAGSSVPGVSFSGRSGNVRCGPIGSADA